MTNPATVSGDLEPLHCWLPCIGDFPGDFLGDNFLGVLHPSGWLKVNACFFAAMGEVLWW